jgi:glycosyltransferase involved in cell wall biosynthesis
MKSLPNNPRVAIVYHYWALYREPIARVLCQQTYPEPEYTLVSGTKVETDDQSKIVTIDPLKSNIPVTEGGLRWRTVNNIWFGRVFLWQSGLLCLSFSKKYDVIIYLGSMYFISTWFSALLARLSGKKVLMWGHGFLREENNLKGFVRKLFYRISHGMLLYGNRARQIMLRKGFEDKNLHVIYNSLDYDRQCVVRNSISEDSILALRRKMFKFPECPVLFFIGRLTLRKRLDLIIAATKQLHLSDKQVNILFIGSGPAEKELQQIISQNNLEDYVCFYGACYEENELGQLIMSSDICVSPGEVGLTAIHAMAYGKPVITHNDFSQQMPEFESIVPGKTGSFYSFGDVDDLALVITSWIEKNKQSDTSSDCISIVEKFYNPHTQVKLINDAVKEVFLRN